MLSFESMNGVAITPALLLQTNTEEKLAITIINPKAHNQACMQTHTDTVTSSNWVIFSSPIQMSYIRICNGRPDELYSDANFLTDTIELRSSSMRSILAVGISLSISSLTFLPASVFLTAMTTWTPRKARTRVVSKPRPLDAPEIKQSKNWKRQNISNFTNPQIHKQREVIKPLSKSMSGFSDE